MRSSTRRASPDNVSFLTRQQRDPSVRARAAGRGDRRATRIRRCSFGAYARSRSFHRIPNSSSPGSQARGPSPRAGGARGRARPRLAGAVESASTPPRSNPRSVHPSSVLELSHRSKRPLTSHDSSHPSQTSARPRPSASAPSTRRGSRCVEFEYSPRAFGSNDPLAPIESPGPRDRPFLTARVPSRVPQVIVERAEKSDIPDLDKKK